MKEHWTGNAVLKSGLVFLLNDGKKEYMHIGEIQDENDRIDSIVEQLKPYVLKYEAQLREGSMMIWTADLLDVVVKELGFDVRSDNFYEASFRVSYAPWMIDDEDYNATEKEKEHPFYYDVAESDERIRFSHVVNGTDIVYGGSGKLVKGENPKEMSL